MPVLGRDLWSVVLDRQYVDPAELTEAIVDQIARADLDYRTRLLIRDSMDALRAYWGAARVEAWLKGCPAGQTIAAICKQEFDEIGFPSLRRRLMEPTRPEQIRQFLRDLSQRLQRPVRISVGGAASLILLGYLSRRTEDVDVVDELPSEFRAQPQLLRDLADRYGLQLGHFQSHYLPSGWVQRLHTQAPFGQLQVSLVDPYDVFLSKLFSIRTKDLDDLRALVPQLEKETLVRKLKDTTQALLGEEQMRERAVKNWYILFGEPLPS